jgi:hypothetical protein
MTTELETRNEVKVLGRRKRGRADLIAAAPFLDMVIALRKGRPFIPRGVHRFISFEESNTWSIRMLARNPSRVPRR